MEKYYYCFKCSTAKPKRYFSSKPNVQVCNTCKLILTIKRYYKLLEKSKPEELGCYSDIDIIHPKYNKKISYEKALELLHTNNFTIYNECSIIDIESFYKDYVKKHTLDIYEYRCYYCGKRADTIDHIVPKSLGGTDEIDNYLACCYFCNTKKSNMLFQDFIKTT